MVNYDEFKLKWDNCKESSIRFDHNHNLDFYLSETENNKKRLVFISGNIKKDMQNSKFIDVLISKRNDGRYMYSFILKDILFKDQFYRLVFDLIDSSRFCKNNNKGQNFVLNLFTKWQKMMKLDSENILTESKIKGLIGELVILKKLLLNNEDRHMVLDAWTGPYGYYHDFKFTTYWYEVKSTGLRNNNITITSIEQLDSINNGNLLIVYLDNIGAKDNILGIQLNMIIKDIEKLILEDINLIQKFREKLIEVGYIYSPKYDEYIYNFKGIKAYLVDKTFPCLRKNNLPAEIGSVKYELSIFGINKWLREDEEWIYKDIEKNY